MTTLLNHQQYLWIYILCILILYPVTSLSKDYDNLSSILDRLLHEESGEITEKDSAVFVYIALQEDRINKLEWVIIFHWLLFAAFLVIYLYSKNQSVTTKLLNQTPVSNNHRIPVSVGNKIKFISPDDITHCMGAISYTELYCLDGSHYSVSRNISKVEAELSPLGFLRVHRSALVNTKYIKSINNNRVIELKNGQQVKLAKSRLPSIRKKMITNS